MYYVYVLVNPENRRIYVGYSEDLRRRFREHEQTHGSAMVELKRRMKLSLDMISQTEEGRSEWGQPTV